MDILFFMCTHFFLEWDTYGVVDKRNWVYVSLKMKSESVGIEIHFVKAGNGNSTLIVSMYRNEWNSTYINMF